MASSLPACNPANWASSVFVAPRDATADINAVAAKFGAAGTVVGINAVTPTNSSFLVEFASADAAAKAVDMFADKPFGSEERGMRVHVALEPLEREVVPNAVYVRNVAREATKEDVSAIFAAVGEVVKVKPVSRRGGGMEVTFADEASVPKAIALSGGSLMDRQYYVEQRKRVPRAARPAKKPRANAAPAAESAPPKPSNKVRVGDLAAGTEESTIQALASAHGEVSKVKVIDSEVSGLHAIVTFGTAEEAAAAAGALDGSNVQGATVSASVTRSRRRRTRKRGGAAAAAGAAGGDAGASKKAPGVADPARIWVGNLPAEIDAEAVTAAFNKFGEVVRFQRRNTSARFCFLTFASADAAKAAVESGSVELDGEQLTIQQSTATRVRADRVRNTRPNRRQVPKEE